MTLPTSGSAGVRWWARRDRRHGDDRRAALGAEARVVLRPLAALRAVLRHHVRYLAQPRTARPSRPSRHRREVRSTRGPPTGCGASDNRSRTARPRPPGRAMPSASMAPPPPRGVVDVLAEGLGILARGRAAGRVAVDGHQRRADDDADHADHQRARSPPSATGTSSCLLSGAAASTAAVGGGGRLRPSAAASARPWAAVASAARLVSDGWRGGAVSSIDLFRPTSSRRGLGQPLPRLPSGADVAGSSVLASSRPWRRGAAADRCSPCRR